MFRVSIGPLQPAVASMIGITKYLFPDVQIKARLGLNCFLCYKKEVSRGSDPSDKTTPIVFDSCVHIIYFFKAQSLFSASTINEGFKCFRVIY